MGNDEASMNENGVDLRSAEYESLRQELLQNKQFVFERPLVIIALAGVAAVQLSDTTPVLALPALLISVLCVNLWFTANRLRSNARIAGYIAATLEPGCPHAWIGWENALRLHRKWYKSTMPAERQTRIKPYLDSDSTPDAMMYFPIILALHAVPAVFAFIASLLTLSDGPRGVRLVMSGLTILATACFAALCRGPYRPCNMTHMIETQRATWLAIFDEHARTASNRADGGLAGA